MERELAGQYCFFCWFCLCLTSTVLAWSHSVAGKIVGGTSLSPSFKFFTPPKGGSFMDEWESRVDEWESRAENHCINCEYQGMMRQWHGICKSSRCLKAGHMIHMIVHAQQMLHNKTFHYFLILLSFFSGVGGNGSLATAWRDDHPKQNICAGPGVQWVARCVLVWGCHGLACCHEALIERNTHAKVDD